MCHLFVEAAALTVSRRLDSRSGLGVSEKLHDVRIEENERYYDERDG
jgi:hypothetical protein